jgi:hypothetical protein
LTDAPDDAPKPSRKRSGRKTGKEGPQAKLTSAKELARRQRIADILSLRLQGWSLDAIGDAQEPQISAQRVHQIIKEHLASTATFVTEEVRRIELARLDELQVKIYENAVKGDLLAIDRVLAIHDRRAKMTGINAPEKIQEVGPVSDAKASLLAKLKKMAERMRPAEIAAPMKDVHGQGQSRLGAGRDPALSQVEG